MSKNIKGLVLITGTTSGVGLNTLKPLLRFGWEVIEVNRKMKSRMIKDHPYQRHITLIMPLEII